MAEGLLKENYHYIDNVTAYETPNEDARRIKQFIEKELFVSKLIHVYAHYMNFDYFFYYMKPLLESSMNDISAIKKDIDQELFNLFESFFGPIYMKQDMDFAYKEVTSFRNHISELLKETAALTKKLLRLYVKMAK